MRVHLLNDPTLGLMERYMTLSAQRQSLISSNLANIDTPGFRTLDIDVQKEIQSSSPQHVRVRSSSPRHFFSNSANQPSPNISEVSESPSRSDLNNVDLDREMMKLSETEAKFSTFAYLVRSHFRILQQTLNEVK